MQADENRRLRRNRFFHPFRESHVHVSRSRHEHVYTSPPQRRLTVLGDFEINVLFQKTIRNGARIRTTMTRVESHNNARRRSSHTSRRTGSSHRDGKGRGFIRRRVDHLLYSLLNGLRRCHIPLIVKRENAHFSRQGLRGVLNGKGVAPSMQIFAESAIIAF